MNSEQIDIFNLIENEKYQRKMKAKKAGFDKNSLTECDIELIEEYKRKNDKLEDLEKKLKSTDCNSSPCSKFLLMYQNLSADIIAVEDFIANGGKDLKSICWVYVEKIT